MIIFLLSIYSLIIVKVLVLIQFSMFDFIIIVKLVKRLTNSRAKKIVCVLFSGALLVV